MPTLESKARATWLDRGPLQVRRNKSTYKLALGIVILWILYTLMNRTGQDTGKITRFDRERDDDDRNVEFPPLDELQNRDRLWPPDLGTLMHRSRASVHSTAPRRSYRGGAWKLT